MMVGAEAPMTWMIAMRSFFSDSSSHLTGMVGGFGRGLVVVDDLLIVCLDGG